MIWTHLNKFRDLGLLVLRVTFGLYMALGHGWGKIAGGPEQWAGLGGIMETFGLGFAPSVWGFMAAFAEFVGGLLVAVGLLTRPAALLVFLNMGVAATAHMTGAIDGSPELAIVYGIVFLSLVLVGPGTYSVDDLVAR
jgi:putative oxidoreductase